MISVTLNRNGAYWQARWRVDGRQFGRGLGKRLDAGGSVGVREAKKARAMLQEALNAGKRVQGASPTLQAFSERFLAGKAGLAGGTLDLYRKTIRYLVGHFGPGRRLDKITRACANGWRAALAGGDLARFNRRNCGQPSESTVCQAVRDAKSIFAAAVDEDLLASNPFSRLKSTAPEPDKDWAYIDRPKLGKLLDACPGPGWKLLLGLCRLAGLRRGEALRLAWADVDLVELRLVVRNPGQVKTTKKRTRTVPIEPELARMLFEASMGDVGELVVDLRESSLRREFAVLVRRAGLEPWARWCHTLRKNCETDWARLHSIHVVAEWLGNSPEVALQRYLKPTEADFERVTGVTRVGQEA